MVPGWLESLSMIVVLVSIVCAIGITVDIVAHPQAMWIMNVVWPLTALYTGPLGVWLYIHLGHRSDKGHKNGKTESFWRKALRGSTHCGAGCAVGDFIGEWLVFAFGIVILGSKLGTKYIVAFVLAYAFGIFFQYFSIAPMRGLGLRDGLIAAVKADTLSLIAYQVGMFAWMGLTQKVLFPGLEPIAWTFWLMMQIAMILGLATTFPVNWWLIKAGIKESM